MEPDVEGVQAVRHPGSLRARMERVLVPGNLSPAALIGVAALAVAGGIVLAFLEIGHARSLVAWLRGPFALPFWLSMRVSLLATALTGTAGTALGYLLAKGRFAGRDTLEAVLSLPVVMPPTVFGYYLLQVFGNGRTGRAATAIFGHYVPFSVTACVIAAFVAALPFVMRASRAAFERVDPVLEQAARVLGMPEWRVALTVSLPLARRAIGAGVGLAFLRALGEYGATLMFGGGLGGRTETMPVAVARAFTVTRLHDYVEILAVMALVGLLVVLTLESPPRGSA